MDKVGGVPWGFAFFEEGCSSEKTNSKENKGDDVTVLSSDFLPRRGS